MRESGILMPVFSIPNKYGIGDFGAQSYKFIDFLSTSKQKVWQILPLVQTGYGNSPYSSISINSFNPYFISPDELVNKGLITVEEAEFSLSNSDRIDYGFLYSVRLPMLKKAFLRFDKNDKDFTEYVKKGKSLDYALFMTLKYASGQKHFYEWEDKYKYRDENALKTLAKDYSEEIAFWQFVQFEAEKEWLKLKDYANKKGILILGDIPLYTALDSVDVWCNPKLYKLDDNFVPKVVAGVPPDYFSENGQLWGNPVYDYEYQEKDNFSWWCDRLKNALNTFDLVRIDHFRGLDRYYEVPFGAENAKMGEWVKVPSEKLFKAIHSVVDKDRIIAEDLGIIDDGVRDLLKKVGYPGMKVLSFAFNGESDNLYLPQNICENSVCYTGTHDNDTLKGLIDNCSEWDKNNILSGVENSIKSMNIELESNADLIDKIVELSFACKSKLNIVPIQDYLKLSEEYRINEPGTVKEQNWAIIINDKYFTKDLANKIKELTVKYKRA
ncbi:MAG: 4-alpha-glucanotransferase [Clostridia bacterium]|nr:4-alpha-glucanotransferase [Clostridia bacterium]